MATATKKVNGTKKAEKKAAKKEKAVFEGGDRNDDGQLISVPTDWNAAEHKRLSKKDFGDVALWLDFEAMLIDRRVEMLQKAAENKRDKATKLRQFGDEATRKKIARVEKLKEAQAKILAELAEGGDVDPEILAALGA
jgi:hypothetical protein